MVQWLGLQASTAGGTGSVPQWGIEIPHATQHSQKKKLQVKKTRPGEMKVQRQDWAWFCAEKMLELGKECMRAHTCLSTTHTKTINIYIYVHGRSNQPGRVLIPGS